MNEFDFIHLHRWIMICTVFPVSHHIGGYKSSQWVDNVGMERVNDPSAGSPTETLLRLLLPLNEQV
jgi:hypothetical protein